MRDGFHFGRVDHIFVLDNFADRHIFVILTPVKRTHTRHNILGLEIMEEVTDKAVIIGITTILPLCLYMVPIKGIGIIWVDWEVYIF